MIKHTITGRDVIPANLHLIDSYKVSKKKFDSELKQIRAFHPDSEVWERGIPLMKLEWSLHSLLYFCGIARSHTKDVDLNYPLTIWEKIIYAIFGGIAWLIIK